MERETRIELATLCLGIKSTLPLAVSTAPDSTRPFLIVRWVILGSTASIYGVGILDAEDRLRVDRIAHDVVVANRDGEITDARSLCSCIHCRLPEAPVSQPSSSVHALFGACTVVSQVNISE